MIVKPQRPVLNRAHPLARGLTFACPLGLRSFYDTNSATGDADLVLGLRGTPNDAGVAAVRQVSPWGFSMGRTDSGIVSRGLVWNSHPGALACSASKPWSMSALCTIDLSTVGASGGGFVCATGQNAGAARLNGLSWAPGTSKFGLRRLCAALGTDLSLASTNTFTNGPHSVVGTYDGATARLYVNGRLEGSAPSAGSVGDTHDRMVVGSYWNSTFVANNSWLGKVADVQLWNRPLSPSEVADLYSDPWALYRPQGFNGLTSAEEFASPITSRAFYYRNFVASRGF